MIPFGMPTLIENRTLEDNAALCRSLGLRFIELNMNFPEYQLERLEETEHLIHFHIHDGSEEPPKNHLALGDGRIDLAARLQLAERRQARCVLETKTVEALKRSVQWLRNNNYML